MRRASGIALIAAACSSAPVRPVTPNATVRLVLQGVPADVAAVGLRTWLGELGLGVAGSPRRECDRPWWKTKAPCEISIGIATEVGLRERVGSDGQTERATREILIDSRILANRPRAWTVIAHELGHVLLDTAEHTTAGVMASQDWVLHGEDHELVRRLVKP